MRAWVPFNDAIAELVLGIGAGEIGIRVLPARHHARPQCARSIERPAHVKLGAVIVPASRIGGELDLALGRRALAHKVDRAAGIPVSRIEPIRTAHHLDMVIGEQIGQPDAVDDRLQAVMHAHGAATVYRQVLHQKPARIKYGGTGIIGGHVDAGHLIERGGHGGDILVLNLLRGQHRDAAGDVAQALRRLAADLRILPGKGLRTLGHRQGKIRAIGAVGRHGCSCALDPHRPQLDRPVSRPGRSFKCIGARATLPEAEACSDQQAG